MLKNISQEEDGNAAYAAHKAKDVPGGQTKRKHQITYLGELVSYGKWQDGELWMLW